MSFDDLRELTQRRPFVGLRLYTSDGNQLDVRHPEMIIVGRRSVAVGLPATAGDNIADRVALLDLLHIVRAEPLERPLPATDQAGQA